MNLLVNLHRTASHLFTSYTPQGVGRRTMPLVTPVLLPYCR